MKLSVKIPMLASIIVLVGMIVIAIIGIVQNVQFNQEISQERIDNAVSALDKEVKRLQELSLKNAIAVSENKMLIDAVAINDFEQMKVALDHLNDYLGADTISITDIDGDVLIRQHQPDKKGDNISNQENIQMALAGKTLTTIESGALAALSCRSGAPIYASNGEILGTVVTGYMFDNPKIVDDLKDIHGAEFTIFEGETRLITTIIKDGERVVGTQVDEKVAERVLIHKEDFSGIADILGEQYRTKYRPLENSHGEVVGILFAGISNENMRLVVKTTIKLAVISIVLLLLLSIALLTYMSKKNIQKPMAQLATLAVMVAEGNLDTNHTTIKKKRKNEIDELVESIFKMIDNLKSYIVDIYTVLGAMSENDFSVDSKVEYQGDFITLSESIEKISYSLNNAFVVFNEIGEQVDVGANQVSQSSSSLATGSTQQAATVEELNASAVEVAKQSDTISQEMKSAVSELDLAGKNLNEGNKYMGQLTQAMSKISTFSDQIVNITKLIGDIAFQTNILALNAAVEAARAGDAGKGFAVVAGEVRDLAAKSAKAAEQTTELIEASVMAVGEGTQLTDQTAKILNEAVLGITRVITRASELEEHSLEQAQAVGQIREGLAQVSGVVQSNAATAQENSAVSVEMSTQAANLKKELSRFILKKQKT